MTSRRFHFTTAALLIAVLLLPAALVAGGKPPEWNRAAPGDAAVKVALPAADLKTAAGLAGKERTFRGRVNRLFKSKSGSVSILNFAADYRKAIVAVVYRKDHARFPPLDKLVGRDILVRGKISLYEGRPQVVLTDPGQVSLIE